MKSFYTALVTMVVLLSLIIFSSICISYLLNVIYDDTDRLAETLGDISQEDMKKTLESIEELSQKWKKDKWIFEIFIPHNEVTYAEIELENISAYAKSLDDGAYRATRSRLLARIEGLSDAVKVSWETVF